MIFLWDLEGGWNVLESVVTVTQPGEYTKNHSALLYLQKASVVHEYIRGNNRLQHCSSVFNKVQKPLYRYYLNDSSTGEWYNCCCMLKLSLILIFLSLQMESFLFYLLFVFTNELHIGKGLNSRIFIKLGVFQNSILLATIQYRFHPHFTRG